MWTLNIRSLYITVSGGERDKNIVPPDANIISSTWAMKKKSDGNHRARLNTRIFEQKYSFRYIKDDVSAPVFNDITIWVVFFLMIVVGWLA